jgi:glycosyltransferase involved in cell wall biosynthesis/O-antigen/teichoic acid export membrane protein
VAVDEEPELKSALERATMTGVRVMGLRISGYAVGFVASVLIARAVGPTGRGLYAYPVALLGLVVALAHLGLEFAQVHLAAQGKDLRHMWADSTVFSVVAGTACWAVVACVVAIDPRATGGLPLSWIAIPMGLVPFLLMSLYWANLLQLDGRLVAATWASWFGVALQTIAIGLLFVVHKLTPFNVLLLQWLTNGSAWLFLLLACRRAGLVNLRVDRALFQRSLRFGVKAYVAQIFFYLVLRVDQVLVAHFAGYRQLGLYALATTVAQLLWLLTDPLASALLPHMVRAPTGDDRRLSFSTARLSLCILLIAAVCGWFLAPVALPVVYGAGFAGAVPALRLLLPGVVALGATRSLGSVLVKEGRMLMTSMLGLSALGLNIALNIVLLPRIGIRGASIASSVCYAALALSYVVIGRRRGVAGWRDLVPRASDLQLLGRVRLGRRADRRAGPLRVALVVGSLNRGGTERQILMLGSALVARGHPVTVICLNSAGDQGAAARAAGIHLVDVGFPGLQRSVLLNPIPEIRRLRRAFRDVSPDVVHCFLYWGYLIGVPIARSVRVPVVVSSRRSLTAAGGRFRLLVPWERMCDRLADAVVCNSSTVMQDAVRHTRLPRRKAVVIRNGVSLPADVAPTSTRPQRVVVVANLLAYKGHATALAAFAQVRALWPESTARLQFAGAGPEEASLRACAREHGIDGDVEFLGSVADVPALLARCSFTVLPSLSEGMPNAVLESLAHGRAVVASAVGGVPEILGRGGGVLVPPGDPEALADAMRALLADPALAARLGAEGRAVVHDQFGTDRMVDESLQLYSQLLAGKSHRATRALGGSPSTEVVPPVPETSSRRDRRDQFRRPDRPQEGALRPGTPRHARAAQPRLPRRAPMTWRARMASVPLRLGYMIVGIGAVGALVLATTVAGHETTAVAAVASAVIFLLALRRISTVALALIPVMVLSSEPLHKTLPSTFLVGVLAVAAIVLFCLGSMRARPIHLMVAVLGAAVLLGYFFPAARLVPAGQVLPNLIAVLGGLVALTVFISAPPTADTLLKVILVTGTAAGVVASAQAESLEGRLEGLGLNPNYLAVYLAAPVVISAGLALRRRNPLWLAPGAACLPALLGSQSREGFLAMIAGLAFVLVQGLPRVQKVPVILAAAVILALSPGHFTSLGAGSRSAAELTSDNLVRVHVALFAVHVALSHPLLGIGLGQFPNYAAASDGFGVYITTTNEYLLLASENGLIALAAFLVMLWLAFRGPCHDDLVLVRAVLVTSAVSILFVDSFATSLVALPFWACLGVLLARRPDQYRMEPTPSPGAAADRKRVSR